MLLFQLKCHIITSKDGFPVIDHFFSLTVLASTFIVEGINRCFNKRIIRNWKYPGNSGDLLVSTYLLNVIDFSRKVSQIQTVFWM